MGLEIMCFNAGFPGLVGREFHLETGLERVSFTTWDFPCLVGKECHLKTECESMISQLLEKEVFPKLPVQKSGWRSPCQALMSTFTLSFLDCEKEQCVCKASWRACTLLDSSRRRLSHRMIYHTHHRSLSLATRYRLTVWEYVK